MTELPHREYEVRVHDMVSPAVEYADYAILEKEPLVSIVMVTYNHEEYISTAIESVLDQRTSYPYELVIGEDCSTDQTPHIVFDYFEKHPDRIRVITSKNNVGMRRNGLRLYESVRGKYIAFCEGDDCWQDPNKLQKQLDFLEHNPEYGLVCSNARSHNIRTGEVVEKAILMRPHLCENGDAYTQLLTGVYHIWPSTVCMCTDLLKTVHHECPECTDESYLMGDTQRFLEIARRTKFKYMDESLATRNLLPESATQSSDLQKKARFSASQKRLLYHYLDKYPVPDRIDRQVREAILKRRLYYAYACRDRELRSAVMSELKNLGLTIAFRYIMYCWGSQNRVFWGVANIGIFILRVKEKVQEIVTNTIRDVSLQK